jgi:two-component system response regulator BaeR
VDGAEVRLTALEFRLLFTLVQRPGRVFGRELLVEEAYGGLVSVSDRTVDTHIKNLRQKLQKITGKKDIIQAVYGMGYTIE